MGQVLIPMAHRVTCEIDVRWRRWVALPILPMLSALPAPDSYRPVALLQALPAEEEALKELLAQTQ